MQKTVSLTFCFKLISDRRIWSSRCWNRVEWAQEMVSNTYHHAKSCPDRKIEFDKKIQRYFFLTSHFKTLSKKMLFNLRNFGLTLKYHQSNIPDSKNKQRFTQKKILMTFGRMWSVILLSYISS